MEWEEVADPADVAAKDPAGLRSDWLAITAHALYGLVGLFLIFNFFFGLYVGGVLLFDSDSAQAAQFRELFSQGSASSTFWNTLLTLSMTAGATFLWVVATRNGRLKGAIQYLQLTTPRASLLRGTLLGVAMVFVVLVLLAILTLVTAGPDGFDNSTSENPSVEGLLKGLNFPLALFIAFAAGVGEELLFRGVLQKWLGWIGQGVVFGFAHAVGGDPIQIIVTMIIGLGFGYMVHRGESLYTVIAAHFVYDIILLSLALYGGEFFT